MKPEAEIRNLKRVLAVHERDCLSMREVTRLLLCRAERAEKECTEWKARFDALLFGGEPEPDARSKADSPRPQ